MGFLLQEMGLKIMTKRRTKTPLEQEYFKQRRRVQQFVRRATKRGYTFQENIIPKIPQKITQQSVQRLSKLSPEKLYEKSEFIVFETGEIVEGRRGRNIERKRSATKRKQRRKRKNDYFPSYDTVDLVRDRIEQLGDSIVLRTRDDIASVKREDSPYYPIEHRKNIILEIFDDTRMMYDDDNAYGKYLSENESRIADCLQVIAYHSEQEDVHNAFTELAILVKGAPLISLEATLLHDAREYDEYYGD